MNASNFQRVVFTLTRNPHTGEILHNTANKYKIAMIHSLPATSEAGITLHNCEIKCSALLDSNDYNLQNDIPFVETLFIGLVLLPRISYLLLIFHEKTTPVIERWLRWGVHLKKLH